MANSGLQLLGFTMAALGWVGLIACTAIPQWQISSYAGDNIITAQAVYKGLWMECISQSTGLISCKMYDSVLALPASMQATRALMVVSLVLGFLAMMVAAMGMKCTRCGGDDKVKKARIAMTGGIVFIVAGLAALIACSWYGHQIVTDFYNPLVPMNTKFEFGSAIFIGWAGSALVFLGGALLSCSCPGSEGKAGYRPPRSYPKPSSAKEYV
ncbi:claudin-7 [Antechinus flavipes]|uniref:claudin-7 n=1 Tax=Antechinus flavipes TaxID=38775 RepID=UPI002235C893|nr:claudin-7 [Antechinus flavipes]XP_051851827.1 claudin-7 [Antechinus flavipes]